MTTAKKAPEKDEADDKEMEMELTSVTLYDNALDYIPGPKATRHQTLKAWCRENCIGKYSTDQTGFVWTFMEAEDAKKFEQAWNSRLKKVETGVIV